MRAGRAGRVGRDHRLRRGRDARLPRLRHGRHRRRTTTPSASTRPTSTRPSGGWSPSSAARGPGHHHLRRRPARLPAPRPPPGPRHLGAGLRPRRRPRLVPRARRAVPAVEALLLDVVAGPHAGRARGPLDARGESPFDEKWFDRPDQDHRITTQIDVSEFQWARTGALRAHATQVDPDRGVLVRADRRRARRGVPVGGLDPRPLAGRADPRPTDASATCSPASRERGASSHVHGRCSTASSSAKKDERVDGPDDADLVLTVPLAVVAGRRLRRHRRVHARPAEGGRSHRPLLDLLKSGEAGAALSRLACASLSSR